MHLNCFSQGKLEIVRLKEEMNTHWDTPIPPPLMDIQKIATKMSVISSDQALLVRCALK